MFGCAFIYLAGRRPRGDGEGRGSPKRTESGVELKSGLKEVADQLNPDEPVESPSLVLQQSKAKGEKTNFGCASAYPVVLLGFIAVALGYIVWQTEFTVFLLIACIVVALGFLASQRF